ncbi:MAG TPA: hypothetical protein DCM05_09285 [Elusimicrobia bacterium]|nr:hypothetical protein [Elusimicrobiota bacterium]
MTLRRAAPLLLAALFLLPPPALAVFTAREMDTIDPEPLFDAEYFLDLLGFSYPLDWEWDWQASSTGYRINGASLDKSDLLLDQQAVFSKRLLDKLSFRYDLEHHGDKDLVSLHQWLCFEAGPWAGFSFGLFGEPQFEKEDADIGALVRWSPWKGGSLYSSINAVDFSFNQRNRTTQTYDRRPYTTEQGFTLPAAGGLLKGAVEVDLPLTRAIPDDDRVFGYRRTRALLRFDRPAAQGVLGLAAEYSYEFKRKADSYTPDPANKDESFVRRVHQATLAGQLLAGPKDRIEAGGRFLRRSVEDSYRDAPGSTRRGLRWEAQPYARWRRTLAPWAVSELAAFLSSGELRWDHPYAPGASTYDTIVRAKLGTGIDFVFGRAGRIGLYANLDLRDADRHLWDGGNIRAMFLF